MEDVSWAASEMVAGITKDDMVMPGKPTGHTLHVTVTAGDIRHGVQSDCSACPLALAISRELRAGVDTFSFYSVLAGTDKVLEHSDAATEFIKRFDRGQLVAPDSYDLVWREREIF